MGYGSELGNKGGTCYMHFSHTQSKKLRMVMDMYI